MDKEINHAYSEVGKLRDNIVLERSRFERFQDGNKLEKIKNEIRDIDKDKKVLNERVLEI